MTSPTTTPTWSAGACLYSSVSRYISNPLLINGYKFDLRVYVLVTSFEPLRVYVYKEGLVRFATEPYNETFEECRFWGPKSKYAHLTNYSINKKSDKFVQNEVCARAFTCCIARALRRTMWATSGASPR